MHTRPRVSGATTLRPPNQHLLKTHARPVRRCRRRGARSAVARPGGRSQACSKRLRFAGVRLMTPGRGRNQRAACRPQRHDERALPEGPRAEGAPRSRRSGARGTVGGGLCFGYDVVREHDARGELIHGGRSINETEAGIVRRVFSEFAAGRSPRRIAVQLNRDHIPGPRGGEWDASTINGNAARGTGILNNELYIGRIVWNRLRYIKDPKQASVFPASMSPIAGSCRKLRVAHRRAGSLGARQEASANTEAGHSSGCSR